MLIALWENMLSDVDYRTAELAIQKHMSESPFPPTVADIRKQVADITVPQQISGMEAWGEVTNAIRRFGSYREEEAKESMSPVTRKVVDYIGYRYLCMSEDEMADRAHFIKAFDTIAQREHRDAMLPLAGKKLMEQLQAENVLKRLDGGANEQETGTGKHLQLPAS